MNKIMTNNPFAPIAPECLGPQCAAPVYDKIRPIYNLIPKAKKVLDVDGVQHDVINYEAEHIQDIDIDEYIKSFEDEVGIQNILKKVALTGDKSYLNQTGRTPLNKDGGLEEVQDYTDVPNNKTEAFNAVVAGVAAYDSLPAELKEKMSFEQFAKDFGQSQLDAYVKKLIEQHTQKEEVK